MQIFICLYNIFRILYMPTKVIDINLSKRNMDIIDQGLLIKDKKIWIVSDSKNRKKL
jgi:hypothetical protein